MAFLNGRHNQALITSFVCPSGPLTFHLPRENVALSKCRQEAEGRRQQAAGHRDQMEIVQWTCQPTSQRSIVPLVAFHLSLSLFLSLYLWRPAAVGLGRERGHGHSLSELALGPAITCVKHVNNLQFGIHK